MSNSRIRACACNSPRFAIKYRNPNAQCAYFAFSVVRMMSGMLAANYLHTKASEQCPNHPPAAWKPTRADALFLLGGQEMEFLSTDAGFEHQAALGDGKHHHPVRVLRIRGGALGGGHGADPGAHRPFATLEVVQGGLVFKEDHLGEVLAAQLRADGELRHVRGSGRGSLFENFARAGRGADANRAFADARKHHIPVGRIKKLLDLRVGFLEELDGVLDLSVEGFLFRSEEHT